MPLAHYCSKSSPGKPAGGDTLFYHERQEQQLCLKHSLNNFLGGEVFTDEDLAASVRNDTVRRFQEEIAKDPEQFANEWGGFTEGGLSTRYVAGNAEEAAELVVDNIYFPLIHADAGETLVDSVRGDNTLHTGITVLRDKAPELDLPEAEVNDFYMGQQDRMVSYLREMEDKVDRIIVGNMVHFMVFRKNAAGDWFLLDGLNPEQIRQKPSEFVQQNPVNGLRYGQYQFLTFTGPEFVPRVKPDARAPLGVVLA